MAFQRIPNQAFFEGFHRFGQAAPPTAIDWILAPAHFRVQDAWIDRARQGELYPSDHYPLVAVLDWQG